MNSISSARRRSSYQPLLDIHQQIQDRGLLSRISRSVTDAIRGATANIVRSVTTSQTLSRITGSAPVNTIGIGAENVLKEMVIKARLDVTEEISILCRSYFPRKDVNVDIDFCTQLAEKIYEGSNLQEEVSLAVQIFCSHMYTIKMIAEEMSFSGLPLDPNVNWDTDTVNLKESIVRYVRCANNSSNLLRVKSKNGTLDTNEQKCFLSSVVSSSDPYNKLLTSSMTTDKKNPAVGQAKVLQACQAYKEATALIRVLNTSK